MRISEIALERCEGHFKIANEGIGAIAGYTRHFFENLEDKTLWSETLRLLLQYQNDRSLGVYCLIVNGLAWDAEIVLRSVYDTFAKIILLGTSSPDDVQVRLAEFWEELPATYDRRRAIHAEKAEKLVVGYSIGDARVFAALRDERFFKTQPQGNKTSRRETEQRWSFSGIIDTIGKSELGLIGMDALGYNYSLASHIAHASPVAFDLMEDRASRVEDKILLEVAHVCRICSDLVSLSAFSTHFATERDSTKAPSPVLADAVQKILASVENDRKEFDASQDGLYR